MCCSSLNMHILAVVLPLFLSWLILLTQPSLGILHTSTNTNDVLDVTNSSFFVAKPGCQSKKCGDLPVPYPFGIGVDCSISGFFNLTCNTSYNPPRLLIGKVQVISFSQTQFRLRSSTVAHRCYDETGVDTNESKYDYWMTLGRNKRISDTENKFTVVGCNVFGSISWQQGEEGLNFTTGCFSLCSSIDVHADVVNGTCAGIGCCQTSIPKGINNFNVSLGRAQPADKYSSRCIYAFLGQKDTFKFKGASDFEYSPDPVQKRIRSKSPVIVDFVIGQQSCSEVDQKNSSAYLCRENAECVNSDSGYGGYRCSCKYGYKGNPYLGCKDIDECIENKLSSDTKLHDCHKEAECINIEGNFTCTCGDGYSGDGKITCVRKPGIKLILGLSFGFLSLLSLLNLLYFGIKRRKLINLREKFFQQNGGLLMKQKISSMDLTSAEPPKIFTIEELKKATNNYAEDRILGQGASGVVYKGILPNQCVVAIKKSKVMDMNQVEQFINELLILTQVNHRNVVKVLGCCFESKVPELIYEYVSNGTLFQHIHRTFSWLTLDHRLRIAIEAASALSYLHSAASIPIIHRDIKSANILLDTNYVAKIADFGASRLVPLDQAQVTTLVQGTLGYLDPEYLQSSQLTEKSDVYSFGIVLAELLTGKKPICLERSEAERNLATYFIVSMKENRLSQILEPRVVREGTSEQLQAIAELVKRCLCLKSDKRPAMKEVVTELERLRKYKKDPWDNEQIHEESENLLSEEARVGSYIEPMSLSTSTSDIPGQYSFNCSVTFPHNSSKN